MADPIRTPSVPTIVLVGCNHRSAALEVREQFALNEAQVRERLGQVSQNPAVEEVVILSTCNRTEYYAATHNEPAAIEALRYWMRLGTSLDDETFARCTYTCGQPNSVRHLAAVAASLDSMVVGEAQILGQVKQAYEIAVGAETVGKWLHALFQRAISVAKTIRTVTSIAEHPVSVSSVAVDLASRVLGDLRERMVVLLGAGVMPELCLKALRARGTTRLVVANRTYARAVELAEQFGGSATPFEERNKALIDADIAICSTASLEPVLTLPMLRSVMQARNQRPLFIIDIAVPRDVEPTVNDLDNVFLYDIDSLEQVAGINAAAREAEIDRCRALIQEEMAAFEQWQHVAIVEPTIKELGEKLRRLGEAELHRLAPKLHDAADEEILKMLAHRLIGKFLNHEIRHIRAVAARQESGAHLEAAWEAYDLHEGE